jgi:hypothetical protein
MLALISRAQITINSLEASCVRRQGVSEAVKPAKKIDVLNIATLQSGASELLSRTDEDLGYIRALFSGSSAASMSPEMTSARFGTITIDGRKTTGGCSAWAVSEARKTVGDLDLAMSVQEKLGNANRTEDQALSPVKFRWLACLTGEARRIVKTRKFNGPSEFRLAFGSDSLLVLRNSASLDNARRELKILERQQADVLVEINRCEKKVGFAQEFQRARSESIARVLAGLNVEGFSGPTR